MTAITLEKAEDTLSRADPALHLVPGHPLNGFGNILSFAIAVPEDKLVALWQQPGLRKLPTSSGRSVVRWLCDARDLLTLPILDTLSS